MKYLFNIFQKDSQVPQNRPVLSSFCLTLIRMSQMDPNTAHNYFFAPSH